MSTMTLEEAGVFIDHNFGGGVYAKYARIPADVELVQHSHPFDHLSILAKGVADVIVDGVATRHDATPRAVCLTIPAGKVHRVVALTDVEWFCIHATEETDPSRVDDAILLGV